MNSLSDSATITIQINNVLDFQDNLIAYYSFNGDASDNGPFQNHADIYNAQLTTDRYGQAMCAYDFDGEGDYMVIPHQDYLDFEAVEDTFSISFWIKSKLKNDFLKLMHDSAIKDLGIFNMDYVKFLLWQHLENKKDNRKQLWSLFILNHWCEKWLK